MGNKITATKAQWYSWTEDFKTRLCNLGVCVELADLPVIIHCNLLEGVPLYILERTDTPEYRQAAAVRDAATFTGSSNNWMWTDDAEQHDIPSDWKEMLPSRRDNMIEFLIYDTFRKDRT